jgi:hypothetical protein
MKKKPKCGKANGRGWRRGAGGYWRLRSRADGVVWSLIASVVAVVVYWIVFSVVSGAGSVYGAIGLGVGTMLGGLLGTLYWLPRENGS